MDQWWTLAILKAGKAIFSWVISFWNTISLGRKGVTNESWIRILFPSLPVCAAYIPDPVQVNPCYSGSHDCDTTAQCVPGEGQHYACVCATGYTGDGRNCYGKRGEGSSIQHSSVQCSIDLLVLIDCLPVHPSIYLRASKWDEMDASLKACLFFALFEHQMLVS